MTGTLSLSPGQLRWGPEPHGEAVPVAVVARGHRDTHQNATH